MDRAFSKLLACAILVACSPSSSQPDAGPDAGVKIVSGHSSAMAITRDGATLFVVNPDADSVSVIDTAGRTLSHEILLAAAHPAVDANGSYAPAVMPRALEGRRARPVTNRFDEHLGPQQIIIKGAPRAAGDSQAERHMMTSTRAAGGRHERFTSAGRRFAPLQPAPRRVSAVRLARPAGRSPNVFVMTY